MRNYRRDIRVNPIGAITTKIAWLVVALIIVWYLFWPQNFATSILGLAEIFWHPADTINDSRVGVSRQQLIDENQNLRNQLEVLAGDQLIADQLIAENLELKNALGRGTNKHTILAAVITRPPYTLYDNIIIDVGKDAGINIGAPVYTLGSTTVIGRVASVSADQSLVVLNSSPGNELDVLIGQKNFAVRATGKGNGSFEVTLPRDAGINVGDFVITPTLSSNYIGKVESLDLEETRTYLKALIAMPINVSMIRFVEVGTDSIVAQPNQNENRDTKKPTNTNSPNLKK